MVGREKPLAPTHHIFLRQEKGTVGSREECRDWENMHIIVSSCRQTLMKTFAGTYPFFNQQQTPGERENVAPYYIISPTSAPQHLYITAQTLCCFIGS